TIYGGDGNDKLFGNGGDDVFYGGSGVDSIEAGIGNDTVFGGDGDDRVNATYGDDVIDGGNGDDWLRGSFGNDTFYSGNNDGDDYEWGGYGDDTFIFYNNFGNDTVDAENEDEVNGDTLDLSAITDDLTVDLSSGNNGNGNFSDGTYTATYIDVENIILSAGTDTLKLADESGNDTVKNFTGPTDNGDGTFTGHDMLDVTSLTRDARTTPVNTNDVVVTDDGNGNAVLTFPGGESLTLIGVSPADLSTPESLVAIGIPAPSDGIVSGTAGNDFIFTGYSGDNDGDFIDNNDAHLSGEFGDDDIVKAGNGDDTVYAGDGNDEAYGGAGSDTVFAGLGDDFVSGGSGNDDLYGEDGADEIKGGIGNDTFTGGAGSDTLSGGDDADVFLGGNAGDKIDGGEGGLDKDTLDLTGSGPLRVVYDAVNSENGRVDFLNGTGGISRSMNFQNIETVIPCFTPGTLISTPNGSRPVESLRQGDRVITRDNGVQKIRWIGSKHLDQAALSANPKLRPVLVRKGSLGFGLPEHDMMLSPNHRVLIRNEKTSLYLGEKEVLTAVKHMINNKDILHVNAQSVNYIHFMFDRHEVVLSDGAWSESFQPGDYALQGIDEAQRNEIYALFPELKSTNTRKAFPSARRTLKAYETRLVI
ncbi:MAG: Hint domain-containing protein, partial [Rhodobacteraceae bacterium]|nr:Hint domain-containing protein [Paracoccaceae bacterium]